MVSRRLRGACSRALPGPAGRLDVVLKDLEELQGLSGAEGALRKQLLKSEAARRWPHLQVTLATADALLIADWGKRQLLKEQFPQT